MNDEIAEILIRICKILGDNKTANIVDFYQDIPENKLYDVLNGFVERLESKNKSRLFEFRDRTKRNFLKKHILDFRANLTIDGEPSIILNDFPDGLKEKDNPVWRVELIYDDEDIRDKDIEDLKFILK